MTCLVTASVAMLTLFSCSRNDVPPASGQRLNVLIITLDTIRAERLSAYGNRDIDTAFVDGLAARGVVFDRCIVPTPLTLPSHTSLFTGTYPVYHGVRDNGNYVAPERLTTMAELFQEAGYRTGGFVGAFVLSSRWGLDQGFDAYTEPEGGFDPQMVSFAQIQRRADAVVDDAISWIGEDRKTPFFAWVHLYDPHLPYDPPPAYADEYPGDPYSGEISFADAQLSRLQAHLNATGLESSTMIVFAGDHGEGLGDHGELDHGLLLYQTTARAPLIIAHPTLRSPGGRRDEVVSLVDILPTVAAAVGLPPPEEAQGTSLWPLLGGDGDFEETPVYSESYYPKLHFGWSPLTAVQDRRFQLIDSSAPELYDLVRDPGQLHNVFDDNPTVVQEMKRRLDTMLEQLGRGALDAASAPDAETIAKLEALGYVTAAAQVGDGDPAEKLPNPADMLWLYTRLVEANNDISAGDEAGGEKKLLEILADNESLVDGWLSLGKLYRRQGRFSEAANAFREAHARRPLDPLMVSRFASALLAAQEPVQAEQLLLAAREQHPDDPYIVFALARVFEKTGRLAEAESMYRRSQALDPRSAPTHVRLAWLALQRGDQAACSRELEAALRLDSRAPEANLVRGQLLESQNRLDEAAQAYRDELDISPRDLSAALTLSRLEGRRGRTAEQEQALRNAIEANPSSPGPYLMLGLTFLQREERYAEAAELAELALQRQPTGQELILNYLLLADLYNRLGDSQREHDFAQRAARMTENQSSP